MSKSMGNFFTIRDVLAKYDAEVVRFFILRAHYRSPINYSDVHLDDARQALSRLYISLKAAPVTSETGPSGPSSIDWNSPYAQRFREAMDDDFNTPEAIAVLFDLAAEINRGGVPELTRLLRALGATLGLLQRDPQGFLQATPVTVDGPSAHEIEAQIAARADAKKSRNFVESDRIRDTLKAAGVLLEDTPQGTTWRRA
jgi:cysteinyl-tRNA synthetase